MAEFTTPEPARRGTGHASLAALGVKLGELDLLAPIRSGVQIPQKAVKYTPFDKLYDALISILAGAHALVEVNEGLRADPALQRAFGRTACAEQSVIQETLSAATEATVEQMETALDQIFRTHSRAAHHDYAHSFQVLDIDFSGLHCGKKAAGATKGFFDGHKSRRGRQLGRVLASRYDEIVVDRLYRGNCQLVSELPQLVKAAEETLSLTAEQRARTILRVDAGGGSVADINAALERGYQYHGKDFCGKRAQKLAKSVTTWYADPTRPERQVGWVEVEASEYVRAVRRFAVRCRKPNNQWAVGVVISTLSAQTVLAETGQPPELASDPAAELFAYANFYDDRGGGIETSVKGDKQGLGITKRNKKRFAAQQMVVQLNALAHNLLVWARGWLEPAAPVVKRLGIKRLVRDLFGIRGTVETEETGRVSRILLNEASPLARRCLAAFQLLVSTQHVVLILGQT